MTPHEILEELKGMMVCRCGPEYTGRGRHDPHCEHDMAPEVQALADYVANLEARTPSVIPLVWQQMVDGAGHPTDLHRAWCPLFEQHFWAEREDRIPVVEARRTARIMKVIQKGGA